MPSVPNILGQPRKPVTMIQPPLSQVTEPETKEVPEPATSPAQVRPTQDELAAQAIQQQTVRKRDEMIPGAEPAYKFTDDDRRAAVAARMAKRYLWEEAPIDEALSYLAEIRAEVERGGLILQKRISELKVEKVKCFGCDNVINISEGRWATMRTRNNFETGLPETAYACSAACGLKLNKDFSHPTRVPQPTER